MNRCMRRVIPSDIETISSSEQRILSTDNFLAMIDLIA
jgi:hypothetical protein